MSKKLTRKLSFMMKQQTALAKSDVTDKEGHHDHDHDHENHDLKYEKEFEFENLIITAKASCHDHAADELGAFQFENEEKLEKFREFVYEAFARTSDDNLLTKKDKP